MHKILLILATILGVSGCSHGEGNYQPNPARDAMILQLMGSRQPMPVYTPTPIPAYQPPMRLQTICNQQGGFTYCN